MPLEALVLSQDAAAIEIIHRVLEDLGVVVEDCSSPTIASELLNIRKFDALIVDCDDLHGALDTLRHLRKAPSNRSSIAFAILNGITSVRTAFDMGANFVLDKPVTLERAARSLRSAHGLMLRERRRYFRQPVQMPISITSSNGVEFLAGATNLSEGGMAIRCQHPLSDAGPYRVRFTLPGTRVNVDARVELAWTGDGQSGLRFQHLQETTRDEMDRWLADHLESEDSGRVFVNASRALARARGAD